MTSRDAKFKLLVAGVLLMALGGWLEVASRSRPPGGLLDTVAPWIVLAGSILTLLYFVVRRAAKPAESEQRDSVLFDQSTQMEEPGKASTDPDRH